jgi:PKD repeat protein
MPTSVLWDFGDGTTSTDRDATHIYQNIGTYNLKVTVFDQQCGNISIEKQIHITDCVRRSIIQGESNIYNSVIAPNPSRGQFQIKIELRIPDDIIIELYDLKGELIERKTRENITFMVDYFEPQSSGLYFIKIRTLKIPSIISKKVMVID